MKPRHTHHEAFDGHAVLTLARHDIRNAHTDETMVAEIVVSVTHSLSQATHGAPTTKRSRTT